jgi:hypothetical protein
MDLLLLLLLLLVIWNLTGSDSQTEFTQRVKEIKPRLQSLQ